MNRYRYLTLWHQQNLSEGNGEPFAVLVEIDADDYREVFGILKQLKGDPDSVSGQVLMKLPEILTERLAAAARRTRRDQSILEALRSELTWNIYSEELAFA